MLLFPRNILYLSCYRCFVPALILFPYKPAPFIDKLIYSLNSYSDKHFPGISDIFIRIIVRYMGKADPYLFLRDLPDQSLQIPDHLLIWTSRVFLVYLPVHIFYINDPFVDIINKDNDIFPVCIK